LQFIFETGEFVIPVPDQVRGDGPGIHRDDSTSVTWMPDRACPQLDWGSGMTRGKINFCNLTSAWFAGMIIVNNIIELIQ
jgi:hypothetical protein